ncbi:unnamed protein product [Amoebophrya sp. A25]|nr:unnamed protein product [Amoebophrya sp. A25]|eukprot:GSA25T00006603001.1
MNETLVERWKRSSTGWSKRIQNVYYKIFGLSYCLVDSLHVHLLMLYWIYSFILSCCS